MTGYRIYWMDREGQVSMETVQDPEEATDALRMILADGAASLAWVEPITPRDDDHGQDEDPILILEIDGHPSVDQGSLQLGQHLEQIHNLDLTGVFLGELPDVDRIHAITSHKAIPDALR